MAAELDARALGRAIQRLRLELHLNQAELAERVGMSRSYISRLEHGFVDQPSIIHADRIATALGVSLAGLLARIDPEGETRELHLEGSLREIAQQLEEYPPAEAEAILRALRQTLAFANDLRRSHDGGPPD